MLLQKPPLGAMPRWLHEEINFDDTSSQSRIEHLSSAIERFKDAGKDPLPEWQTEIDEIRNELNK